MRLFAFFILSLCLPYTSLACQDSIPDKSIFEDLQFDEDVAVTIITNLDSIINFRRRTTYQPASFSYHNKDGDLITQKIKIRPRGKYRRRVCDFPSLKLNFSKKKLKAMDMSKYDEYKLVTHCLDDEIISNENIRREYLIYKLFNILSDKSFKVQLLTITYQDQDNPAYKIKRSGFLIEDEGQFEDRLSLKVMEEPKLPMDSFDLEQYNFVALFQYMIGNVDWRATPYAKNIKVIKLPDTIAYQVVPYDFDFSGLVNVSYLRLAEHLNQKSARQRIFLGTISDSSDLHDLFDYYKSKKKTLLDFIADFDLLSKSSRRNIKKYIASFYDDITDGEVATKENLSK